MSELGGDHVASHRSPRPHCASALLERVHDAWYGRLKFKDRPLWVILVSWGIAFFEYCLAVPANRWGSGVYSAAEL